MTINTQTGEVESFALDAGRSKLELTKAQAFELMKPLHPSRVANRKQGGSTLSYVEAYDIKALLIRVFGFGNFSADVVDSEVLRIIEADEPVLNWVNGKPGGPKLDANGDPITKHMFTVLAKCTVRLTLHESGATYTESAAASQKGPDIGEVTDFSIKTAESDALKRAAIYLGTQFGLSLYNSGSLDDVVVKLFDEQQRTAFAEATRDMQEFLAKKAQGQVAQQPVQQAPQGVEGNGQQALAGAFAGN